MQHTKRILIYLLGMVILALGIVLNTKTSFGVAPLVSIAFCVSELTGLKFGNLALAVYLVFFLIEAFLKGRDLKTFDFLQIPFCYLFTRCMNLFSALLPSPESIPLRILLLVLAILCTGFGTTIMVSMHLVPNPADGMVQALGVRTGKSMGISKNLCDITIVAITIIIGLICARRIVGVGIGTICAMLGTGRAVALCSRIFGERLEAIFRAAPIFFADGTQKQT